jgi:predicted AAA+ superfamily ATPase
MEFASLISSPWYSLVILPFYGRVLSSGIIGIYYYRDHHCREIDFLVETSTGELWGIEVKGGTQVHDDDFRHLQWFANNMAKGCCFTGVIRYNGQWSRRCGERFFAVPIQTLWAE